MAKVTSKLQVTVPKAIADQYGIRPGDDIEWIPAGDAVRVQRAGLRAQASAPSVIARRLELFDLATERQRARQKRAKRIRPKARERGWRREDLYERGRAR